MIPVKQLFRHDPEQGVFGDCHRAAIASILELPCEAVPHFAAPPMADDWQRHEREFLLTHGIIPLTTVFSHTEDLPALLQGMAFYNPNVYWLLGGTSRNGTGHTVVVLNDAIIHDPSLDDSGIVGPMDNGHYWGTFFGSARASKVLQ